MMLSGKVRMSSTICDDEYTPVGGKVSYVQQYKIILLFDDLWAGWSSLHVMSFLKALCEVDNSKRQNPDFITFLINHPCLLTFVKRNMLYYLVDQLNLKQLSLTEPNHVSALLEVIVDLVGYIGTPIVCSVHRLK